MATCRSTGGRAACRFLSVIFVDTPQRYNDGADHSLLPQNGACFGCPLRCDVQVTDRSSRVSPCRPTSSETPKTAHYLEDRSDECIRTQRRHVSGSDGARSSVCECAASAALLSPCKTLARGGTLVGHQAINCTRTYLRLSPLFTAQLTRKGTFHLGTGPCYYSLLVDLSANQTSVSYLHAFLSSR